MKWRLFAVAAAAILPTLISLGYNEFAIRQTYIDGVYRDALRISRQSQFEIEQIIDEVSAVLYATSTAKYVSSQTTEGCTDVLKRLVNSDPAIASIAMVGLEGKVLCSNDPEASTKDFSSKSVFKLAVTNRSRSVGELSWNSATKQYELPISVPVRDADNSFVGVLVGCMPIPWLGDRIRERGVATGGALTIADRDGVIIARNPYPERFVGTRIPDAFMNLVHATTPGTIAIVSQDGTHRILGYQPPAAGTLGLYVSAGISEDEVLGIVNQFTWSGILAIISGLALGVLAAWFVGSRFVYRPILKIVGTVNAWRGGAIDARTGLNDSDGDIGEIGEALDEFIAELARARAASERAEAHRDLLMHELGHRVKNTLSIAVSIANQMFRNSPDDRQAFAQRLTALAGAYDLLLADDWTSADIAAVVEKTLAPHIHTRGQIEVSGPNLSLPSQLVLALSLVLHELATNAVKYGALSTSEGHLTIHWKLGADSTEAVVMTWTESDGPPVTPPTRQGFGSKLIVRAFQSQFNSSIDFDYAVDGLKCRIEFHVPTASADVADFVP